MDNAPWSRIVPALSGLGLLYLVSQFARNALGVISGDIEKALALEATETALLAGAMFLAYGVAQLPAAALLTRLGPRPVLPAAAALLALGLFCFARAESFPGLLASRLLMGAAAAPVLTGAYALMTGFGEDRFTSITGLLTAFGRAGVVVATTPLALLVAAIGWRDSFVWAAAATIAAGLAAALAVITVPRTKTPRSTGAGRSTLWLLLGSPSFRVAALFQGMTSAVGSTILGLWGGPWLSNVYDMDVRERGGMLLAMAVAWFASAPVWGHFAAHPGCRTAMKAAAAASVALLLIPAAVHLPAALILPWLALLGAGTGFYPAVLAELRREVPPGTIVYLSTLLTAGTMLVVFTVQIATGVTADLLPGWPGHHPEQAYSIIFGLLAILLAAASLVYFVTMRPAAASQR